MCMRIPPATFTLAAALLAGCAAGPSGGAEPVPSASSTATVTVTATPASRSQAPESQGTGQPTAISLPSKEGLCQLVATEEQTRLGITQVEPYGTSADEQTCYFLVVPGSSTKNVGYSVTAFDSAKALTNAVSGGDMPERAQPIRIAGRAAALVMTYGNRWTANVTVDAGDGRYLYVSRWVLKHTMPAEQLTDETLAFAEAVVATLSA